MCCFGIFATFGFEWVSWPSARNAAGPFKKLHGFLMKMWLHLGFSCKTHSPNKTQSLQSHTHSSHCLDPCIVHSYFHSCLKEKPGEHQENCSFCEVLLFSGGPEEQSVKQWSQSFAVWSTSLPRWPFFNLSASGAVSNCQQKEWKSPQVLLLLSLCACKGVWH